MVKNKNADKERILREGLRANYPQYNAGDYDFIVNLIEKELSDDNVKHIGLIGSYGSGKSSVLKAFYDKRVIEGTYDKIVAVSLTEFDDNKSNHREENELECILIQQILFSVDKNKIPNSRVQRIGIKNNLWFTIISGLFFTSFLALNIFDGFPFGISQWILNLITIVLGAIFIVFLILALPITSFKANFKGIEISTDNKNGTLFDNYFDELLYFFKVTKKNIVVFEDIDRCECANTLFSRLYTLNKTLNSSPDLSNNIKFIYAVKEDAFISSEQKSKFFDVMISIPPIFTSENAVERLIGALSENDTKIFDISFLTDVSDFIHYYRQLNNIINSYNIFSADRGLTTKQKKELFVLMIYKSLYPMDYKNFIIGEGVLSSILANKSIAYEDIDDQYYPFINEEKDKIKVKKKTYFDEINNFHSKFNDLISLDSVALVSTFSDKLFKTNEAKLFYRDINIKPEYLVFDHIYENPEAILTYKNALIKAKNVAFLNDSIFKELYRNQKNYQSFKIVFERSFFENEQTHSDFIINLIKNHLYDKEYNVLRFLLSLFEKGENIFDIIYNDTFSVSENDLIYICTHCLLNVDLYKKNDKNGNISDFLNKSGKTLDYLLTTNDELFEYILKSKKVIIQSFKSSVHKLSSYSERITKIVANLLFIPSDVNYLDIAKLVNPNYKSCLFTSLFNFTGNLKIIDHFFNSIVDLNSINELIYSDFSKESGDVLNHILIVADEHKEIINKVVETCPVFRIDLQSIPKAPIILQLLNFNKIKGTVNDFSYVRTLFLNNAITFDWAEYLIQNDNLLLSTNFDESKDVGSFVYNVLNSSKITHDNCEKILKKCVYDKCLDIGKISNEGVKFCAIEFRYATYNSSLIEYCNSSDETIAKLLARNYFDDLCNNKVTSLSFFPELAANILKTCINRKELKNLVLLFQNHIYQYPKHFLFLANKISKIKDQALAKVAESLIALVENPVIATNLFNSYLSFFGDETLPVSLFNSIIVKVDKIEIKYKKIDEYKNLLDFVNKCFPDIVAIEINNESKIIILIIRK